MKKEISVVKRNGKTEQLAISKLHKMVLSACEGLSEVYPSQVEMKSSIQFYDGMTTEEIQKILINSAVNLITLENPNYDYVASRLMLFSLRKKVWGSEVPPSLFSVVTRNTCSGYYDKHLIQSYELKDWDEMEEMIEHSRDMLFTYAGLKQVIDRYLVQDRIEKCHLETPQFMYMLIGASLFSNYPKETRLKYVKDFYDAVSKFKISLPTPIMNGVRTPLRQFASCILFDVGDDLQSIFATNSAMGHYVAQRAGIGLNMGRIRRKGAKIRGGEVEHTGVIPFLKMYEATTHSCLQNGVRGGAATCFYPIWHYDIEDIIVLRNNQGSEDNRIKQTDHTIQISELFYKRYLNEEKITLFSPHDALDLYDAWGMDNFDELYLAYEKRTDIDKKEISAIQLFEDIMKERCETGRIYIQNIDHSNSHSHTKLPIRMSNLCLEITLPTKPIVSNDDKEGRIATCILSALNVGIAKFSEYEKLCDIMVRSLDELIDYQRYPIIAAEIYTKSQRTLGIGIINYAYYLAKNKAAWDSEEARKLTHQMAEKFQYSLLKASNNLAKEKGACPEFNTSKYFDGILPIDTYSKFVDTFAKFEYECDWETLRESIKQYGLRNNALSALMPSESSSVVSNATNGIEPPRELLTVKRNQKGDMKMIVPGYSKFKNYYELLFDMKSPKPYLTNLAIIQKFVDQSISTNISYNPEHYENFEIPMSVLISDLIYSQKCGIKTLYYNNTYDMDENDVQEVKSGCESGACVL